MDSFSDDFRALMGFAPMDWQARLYREHFAQGALPGAVDVPTGLGKTAVMAIWLIARACGAALPRRLVYVVDRRAVVDQATAEAMKLRDALKQSAAHLKALLGLEKHLPISTLRGAYVDNREWLENPALPAIIVGTVDMIGSRLLFEGYGVSRKMRPYHAGLLGADALVVLDEAHLVPPFQHLLRAIEQDAPSWGSDAARPLVPPFRLLPLSATQVDAPQTAAPFRLERDDWENDEIAQQRLNARKRLRFVELSGDPDKQLAEAAWTLATENGPKRVVVFCNRRAKKDDGAGPSADGVVEALAKLAKPARGENEAKADIELLVGARRQRERDRAADRLKALRFIGEKTTRARPAFLVATSAGEVGVDIDADHMVSDLAPWERMVQRLGRVNRRGEGDAEVVVFWSALKVKKESEATDVEQRALIAFAAKAALEALPRTGDAFDASPRALRDLAKDGAHAEAIRKATTPEPLRPALTRPLVEAWSMTSLEEHTGRPEVAPWLRGWVDEAPQTTLVWRAHLPVREGAPDWPRTNADKQEIEAFFEAAPPHESEKLETETYHVVDWLGARAVELLKAAKAPAYEESEDAEADLIAGTEPDEESEPPETETAEAASRDKLQAADIAAIALSPAGDFVRAYRLRELSDKKDEKKRFISELSGLTLILDARFAGLSKDGLLDERFVESAETADADAEWSAVTKVRVRRLAEKPDRDPDWRQELAFVTRFDPEGAPAEWLVVDHFRDAPRAEDARALARKAQTLEDHETSAEEQARAIAEALALPSEARDALTLAARLHDEGKRAERWQRAFKAARDAKRDHLNGPLAKTRGPIDHAILDGYRHEFGSLPYVEAHARFKALPNADWRDLVLHLVAAHHGQARPVIETRSCEDAPPSALQERARDIALRFARLQQRWGPWGLAWWEALLRAADQQASRDLEVAAPDAAQEAA